MSKAVIGAIEIGAAIAATAWVGGVGGIAVLAAQGGMLAMYAGATVALAGSGIATEAGALAQKLGSPNEIGVTTHTAAALRKIVRGTRRLGGDAVYRSTTGAGGSGGNYVYNYVIPVATHEISAFQNLWLDGRQCYWKQTANPQGFHSNVGCGSVSTPPTAAVTIVSGAITAITAAGGSGFANVKPVDGYRVRIQGDGIGAVVWAYNSGTIASPTWTVTVEQGGSGYTTATAEIQGAYTFGGTGAADAQDPTDPDFGRGYSIAPDGTHYNFDGKIYAEVRFGDQPQGDVMNSLVLNDSAWSNPPGGDAGSNQAIINGIVDPVSGELVAAQVMQGGYGYTGSTIAITFSGGAAATGHIIEGRVSYCDVTSVGSGLTANVEGSLSAPAGSGSSAPSVEDIAYIYLNVGYCDQFQQEPQMRITVDGKNEI